MSTPTPKNPTQNQHITPIPTNRRQFHVTWMAHGAVEVFTKYSDHCMMGYCQNLCMASSGGGAVLAFSVGEFDAANDLGELV